MSTIIFAVLPVFAIIVAGFAVNRTGMMSQEFWQEANKLVYWFLFPAFLFHKTSSISLGELSGIGFIAAILVAFSLCAGLILILTKSFATPAPAITSMLQGASRHNTFIALAIADRLFGESGLALAAIATAALVPFTNLTVISSMTALLSQGVKGNLGHNMLKELLRNPFIISIGAGISINLAGVGAIPVLTDSSAIIGRAALPIVLLCIGASLNSHHSRNSIQQVFIASVVKLLIFPVFTAIAIYLLSLPALEGMILMLYAALPTSSAAYALARQMGGDAALMANTITFQTAVSVVTLPTTLWLSSMWLNYPF